MAAVGTNLSGPAQDFLREARALAAVLGAFDPLALVAQLKPAPSETAPSKTGPILSEAMVYDALGELSQDCQEVESDIRRAWRMRPEARRVTLRQLDSNGDLALTAQAAQALETDSFGDFLVKAASGRTDWREVEATASLEDLNALDSALGFLGREEERCDVGAAIQRAEIETAFRFILPGDLLGRDSELGEMHEFVRGEASQGDDAPPLFLLTGNGGAGKSALLTEFARRELAKGSDAMPVIWLDFDRPTLASTDPLTLMLELVRQLALFRPDLRAPLRALAAVLEEEAANAVLNGGSREGGISFAFSVWRTYLGEAMPFAGPVVLVLDTFEEALAHGDWNADRVLRWIDGLFYEAGFVALKPILAGRAFDADWRKAIAPRTAGAIELGSLNPNAAGQLLGAFLAMRGAEPAPYRIEELVARYGGNPLVLKIMAQFLADAGPGAQAELLEGDGGTGGALREELAQQFLYKRILSRIRTHDGDLVKLAFPGLALRRVTADLVLEVLAGPCEIKGLDPPRAQALVDALAQQVWLVQADAQTGTLHHRRDLRRLMLEAVPAERLGILRTIHAGAADYYGKERDPALEPVSQRIEAAYHRLMAGEDLAQLADPEAAHAFLDALGEDASTLPARALAELKFHAGKVLAESEAAELDEARRRTIRDEKMLKGARSGYLEAQMADEAEPDFVVPAPLPGGPALAGRPGAEGIAADRAVATAFSRGDVTALAELVMPAFELEFLGEERRSARLPRDLSETALWQACLGAMAAGETSRIQALLSEAQVHPGREAWAFQPMTSDRKAGISKGEVLAMLSGLIGQPERAHGFIERFRPRPMARVTAIGFVRALQILPIYPEDGRVYISLDFVRYLSGKTVLWLRDQFRAAGNHDTEFTAWRQRLKATPLSPMHALQPFTNWDVVPERRQLLARHVMMPELHLPVAHHLARTVRDVTVRAAGAIADKAYAWPLELSGDELEVHIARDVRRWTATLVEFADRAGELETLVEAIVAQRPEGAGTLAMLRAYRQALVRAEKVSLQPSGS